ncbi:hypothetical protein E1295_36735 [Nonomuraea mesophila]|uniref:Uncharacterized protein n=1 Tax=Nonomuraea mesophila TaxID=2530382 RepID=A0A4R5EKH2_9ACTN|nr:hypothetical protein [Nonomuraea mesophila]TDE34763.1 hypothetical protein E1295_36735 [Nonomuraea mesophila]
MGDRSRFETAGKTFGQEVIELSDGTELVYAQFTVGERDPPGRLVVEGASVEHEQNFVAFLRERRPVDHEETADDRLDPQFFANIADARVARARAWANGTLS